MKGTLSDRPLSFAGDPENQLNNNFNMGVIDQDESMYGYDSYDQNMGYGDTMANTGSVSGVAKMLPSVPGSQHGSHQQQQQQQVPFVTHTTSSTSQARNFFQSKNNTTFHSTVENISEEDPPSSSALLPSSNHMKMSTNNSYELEDMSVDKSLYGSSFHTDIDEYDLIANGDIKQNFTYTEKNLLATGAVGGAVAAAGDASGPLKTDATKSKLSHAAFVDNDTVNNNSANRVGAAYKGTATVDYADEYNSFNEGAGTTYGNRSLGGPAEVDEFSSYDQKSHDHYYGDHQEVGDEDKYYDGAGAGGYMGGNRKMPMGMQDAGGGQDYYYNQVVDLGTVVGSNLEGIEELDEYERDDKEEEDEDEEAGHEGYDYNNYYKKKDSLKGQQQHEFIEEEEEEAEDKHHLPRDHSEEFIHDEEEDLKEDSKHWNDDYIRHHASDDEIIDAEPKKTVPPATTTTTTTTLTTHAENLGPSPLSGISALMSSMAPSAVSQSSLSPGSCLASGITTTLAANISNTITTTITGSPSIIFDPEGEVGAATLSKTLGPLGAGDGGAKPTPKQRWHHAYNKIIMQLNVSTRGEGNGGCGGSVNPFSGQGTGNGGSIVAKGEVRTRNSGIITYHAVVE